MADPVRHQVRAEELLPGDRIPCDTLPVGERPHGGTHARVRGRSVGGNGTVHLYIGSEIVGSLATTRTTGELVWVEPYVPPSAP